MISVLPTVPSLVSNSETSAGVKNSPPDFPAPDAYMVIRYSYASPKASISCSFTSPRCIFATPCRSFARRSFLFATVDPSLLLFTSKSSNNPAKLLSEDDPFAELSMWLNTRSKVSFRFSSLSDSLFTLQKSSEGRMKNPFSSTNPSRASSASASGILA